MKGGIIRILGAAALLGLVAASPGCRSVGPSGQEAAATKPLIIAHYMTWFGLPDRSGAWYQWKFGMSGIPPEKFHDPDFTLPNGRRDVAAVHYPVIGPYDSTDPDVLEYHILLAKAAGIDGFMVNWYGFEDGAGRRRQEDKGFEQLLRVADRLGFTVCINLDDKCSFRDYRKCESRADAVAFAQATLLRVMTNYAVNPAYLRIENRPVLSNFGSIYSEGKSLDETSFSTAEWEVIINSLADHHPFFIHDHQWHWKKSIEQAGFLGSAASVFPWIGMKDDRLAFYDEARRLLGEGNIRIVCGVANPGFDNTPCQGWGGGISIVPRRDGAEYREEFDEAVASGAGFIQLATWNDFTEGSTIEPTEEYGDLYLRITAEYANRWAAHGKFGTCLDLPKQVYELRKLADLIERKNELPPASIADVRNATDSAAQLLAKNDKSGCERSLARARNIAAGRVESAPDAEISASLQPGSNLVSAGTSSELRLDISNPSPSDRVARIQLFVRGIPQEWVSAPESVALAARGTTSLVVTVQVPADGAGEAWIAAAVNADAMRVNSNLSRIRIIHPRLRADVGPVHLLRPGKAEELVLTLESSDEPSAPATIVLRGPEGWTVTPTQLVREIAGDSVTAIPVTVRPGPDADGDGALEVEVARNGSALHFTAPFAVRAPDAALLWETDIDQDGVRDQVLGNAAIEVSCTPGFGARILSIINRSTGKSQLHLARPRIEKTAEAWVEVGGINDTFPGPWPGEVWNKRWGRVFVVPDTRGAAVAFWTRAGNGLTIRKQISVTSTTPAVTVSYEIQNSSSEPRQGGWTSHPDLAPGGTAGPEDVMVVPVTGGGTGDVTLATTEFTQARSKTTFTPGENWMLAYDRNTGEYIGQVFDRAVFQAVGIWQDIEFFTMELTCEGWTLNPGEARTFAVAYYVGRGSLDDAVSTLRTFAAGPIP